MVATEVLASKQNIHSTCKHLTMIAILIGLLWAAHIQFHFSHIKLLILLKLLAKSRDSMLIKKNRLLGLLRIKFLFTASFFSITCSMIRGCLAVTP